MKRDLYWDSLKAILIILVIYGHVISPYAPEGSFNRAINSLLAMFRMPLFIFVSGRFSHIHDRERYKKGIIRLIETFIVFQIIRTAIPFILENDLRSLFCPRWILWYLVSLTYWRLFIYFTPEKWHEYRCQIIIISFFMSFMFGFVPIRSLFGIQSTITFFPLFILGYYSIDIDLRGFINKIPLSVAVSFLILLFLFFYFVMNDNLDHITGCWPYWTDNKKELILTRFVSRCLYIFSSVIASAMVLRLIPTNETIAKWGKATLFIFIYHSFAVREFLIPLIETGFLPQNEWFLIAYAVAIFFGLLFLSHFRLLNLLLNPISYLWNHYKKN